MYTACPLKVLVGEGSQLESTKTQHVFFRDRYAPAYNLANWWMSLKTILFVCAFLAFLAGVFGAIKAGVGAVAVGVISAVIFWFFGTCLEVAAVLLRVEVDQAVSVVPQLDPEERFQIIRNFNGSSSRIGMTTPGTSQTMRYVKDRGEKVDISIEQIVERVRAEPGAEHLVWKPGMADWSEPHKVPAFNGLLDIENTDDSPTG